MAMKLVLCYSSLCTELQNGIHAEDWCAYAQATVSQIYQTDLNNQYIGTYIPKSEPGLGMRLLCSKN